jgi:diguanylate cyclase (GGDEF)-like protein
MDFFKQQQQLFGFDKDAYFEAIAEVPVVNQAKLPSIMALLIGWAQQIAARSLAEKRAIAALASVEEQVKQRTHELAEKQRALEMANAKLQQQIAIVNRLSITDELTQLYNRRYFNTIFPKEIRRAARENTTLSFLTFDIDHFKQYNDHYGHQKGDEVLRAIGQTLKAQCHRASDTPFRLGGEEFGVIFLNLDCQEAKCFANKICHAIENLHIEHLSSSVARYITASFGLVTMRSHSELNMDYLYKQADDALYQAKAEGKNRVICITE